MSQIEVYKKPPIGVMPEKLFLFIQNADRVKALSEAITRYCEAEVPVPPEWLEELERRAK